jgi:tetratricopeptide (TPR) repeat protein
VYRSNLAIAYYIVGDFHESIKIADRIVNDVNDIESKSKHALAVVKPAEVFNNLAIFYMMKGWEYRDKSELLFRATESAIRQVKHTSHKSILTILNNLMIFFFTKQMPEYKAITEELHQKIKKSQVKKPLYLINIAAVNYKSGEHEATKKITESLKSLAESDEGIHYFDLDNLKRIFLLSSLNNIKLKRLEEFEKDMANYKSLLPLPEDDPLQAAKAERMHAIGLIKFGQVDRARRILENY